MALTETQISYIRGTISRVLGEMLGYRPEFSPSVTITKIESMDEGFLIEGSYRIFGERGSFKTLLSKAFQVINIELKRQEQGT